MKSFHLQSFQIKATQEQSPPSGSGHALLTLSRPRRYNQSPLSSPSPPSPLHLPGYNHPIPITPFLMFDIQAICQFVFNLCIMCIYGFHWNVDNCSVMEMIFAKYVHQIKNAELQTCLRLLKGQNFSLRLLLKKKLILAAILLCLFSLTFSQTNPKNLQFDNLFYFLLHNMFQPSGPDHVLVTTGRF